MEELHKIRKELEAKLKDLTPQEAATKINQDVEKYISENNLKLKIRKHRKQ